MIYGSVCSGIEAATVAWEPLGWKAAFFSEIEKFPSAVLAHHYPDVPNLGDMTKHQEWNHGAIDLLVGGTPCQSFSVAGLRKGMADPRGNLALVFLSLLERTRARWVVWENVPGVLSSNGGRDFGAFLGALVELGYGFAYRVLDAQYFGVPQRRRRVFVVGYFGDWRPAVSVLFERESLSGHPAPRREKGQRVAPCLSQSLKSSGGIGMSNQELFSQGGGGLHFECFENHPNDSRITESGDLCPTISSRACTGGGNLPLVMAHGQGNAETCRDGEPSLTCNHEAPILIQDGRGMDKAQNGRGYDESGTAYTLDGVSHQAVCFQHQNSESCGMGVSDIFPSLQTDKEPAVFVPVAFNSDQSEKTRSMGEREEQTPTLRAGGEVSVAYHRNASCAVTAQDDKTAALRSVGEHSYQFIQQDAVIRRLTPRECERLQGFPNDYTLIPWRKGEAPDGLRYKALGNSMAVPVMSWIGERIQTVEDSL